MKIYLIFLVLGLTFYISPVQAQRGGILGYIGNIISGQGSLRTCNCKCGVPNDEVRRRSEDQVKQPEQKPLEKNSPESSDKNQLSEEIIYAIQEDAMFTELVQQAEENASKCDCDKPKVDAPVQKKLPPVEVPVAPVAPVPVPSPAVVKVQDKVIAEERKGRLLAGDTPPPHEFPWLAIVHVVGKEPVAGGALITDRHILTAATPLMGLSAQSVKVSLGVHDRCDNDATSTNFSVEAINRHPSFSPTEPAHDLALLTLAATVRFDPRIHPICLPPAATAFQGQVTTIVSWQEPASDEPPGCLPRRIHLPVLRREECIKGLTQPTLLTPEKSCIGTFGSNTVVCPGDVGTPVQYSMNGKYFLLGIMSNTNTCEDTSSTLFTRVADHLNWIAASTKDDCYCNRT